MINRLKSIEIFDLSDYFLSLQLKQICYNPSFNIMQNKLMNNFFLSNYTIQYKASLAFFYQISIMKYVILIALLLALGLTNDCGGNCPSGKCPICFCGTTKNMQDISVWCSKYKWDQKCCKCIVSTASGGNANALNFNSNGSYDAGLFQINNINWGSCTTGKAPCDPTINLDCAIKLYQWGNNTWKAWPAAKNCGC